MFWIASGFVIFWSESQSAVRMWDDSIALGGVAQAIRSRTSSVKCQGKNLVANWPVPSLWHFIQLAAY